MVKRFVEKKNQQIYHCISSLRPEEGANPNFAQIYIADMNESEEVDRRLKVSAKSGNQLDKNTMKISKLFCFF